MAAWAEGAANRVAAETTDRAAVVSVFVMVFTYGLDAADGTEVHRFLLPWSRRHSRSPRG
ncbi:hypothetical protein GCM10010140_72140 [Streptosporangium pseudovulgare]|uniref:Uncharacterized protein n=1 Tax=Streptosporangium pseudovulgare TaxID=35765 RepID=A0ABQ2RLA8_9ACTN|nr:hypothetical protein GCM10010140_72140 [Streptosporangium pseudovulgare]